MRSRHRRRALFGWALTAAIGALALLAFPGVAAAKDRNHDKIPDRWEKRHHLSLKVRQSGRDQDRDHLRNRAEFLTDNDPRDRDSDDDGVIDGDENAGRVASFDPATGLLIIDLFGGDSVSGIVNGDTRIECEAGENEMARASHEGEDNSGPGSEGEDNSGPDPSGEEEDNSGPENGDLADDGNQNEDEHDCTTAALVEGAVVEEAELALANGVATFEEVELAG